LTGFDMVDLKRKNFIFEQTKHPALRLCLCAILGCIVFAVCGCSDKGKPGSVQREVSKSYQADKVQIRQMLDSNDITIADTVELKIETALPEGFRLTMPNIEQTLSRAETVWKLLSEQTQPRYLDKNERVVRGYSYELATYETGDLQIPGFEFEIYEAADSNEPSDLIRTAPINIRVRPAVDINDANSAQSQLADIEPVAEMQSGPGTAAIVSVIIIASLLVAAILYYILAKRRAKMTNAVERKSPAEIAYERLAQLAGEKLLENGMINVFYEKLGNILRYYIEDRFEIHAPERTTEEFFSEIRQSTILKEEDKRQLRKFLEHCDLVKFAKHQPTSQQANDSLKMLHEFIENTKAVEPDETGQKNQTAITANNTKQLSGGVK
jgi:hypothetical protein